MTKTSKATKPETLTYEQVNEKYGDVEVQFSSYYKYTFYFTGQVNANHKIVASVGGNGEDIYRLDVSSDPTQLKYLDFYAVEVTKESPAGKRKTIVEEYYDY